MTTSTTCLCNAPTPQWKGHLKVSFERLQNSKLCIRQRLIFDVTLHLQASLLVACLQSNFIIRAITNNGWPSRKRVGQHGPMERTILGM
jgi:hypothetical protein